MPKVSLLGDSKASQIDSKDELSQKFPRDGEKKKEAEVKGGERRREERSPVLKHLPRMHRPRA